MNDENISFVLHAYFRSEQTGEKAISIQNTRDMLNTKNSEYICDYIAHIKKAINPEIINGWITNNWIQYTSQSPQ